MSLRWDTTTIDMSENLPQTQGDTDVQSDDELVVKNAAAGSGVKDIDVVSENHPLVQEAGTANIKTQTNDGLGEFLSSTIYEHDSVFVREYLQNSESACIRAAKHLLREHPDFDAGWLTVYQWVDAKTGEEVATYEHDDVDRQTVLAEHDVASNTVRKLEQPRPVPAIISKAREYGYDPTIEIEVYRDDRKIVWQDNGIGMTSHEAVEAFMHNFNSGSALEEQSGGKFGIGAKTHGLCTGKDAGMKVTTATRRVDESDRDQDGFRFYAYLGGANPLPAKEEEDIPDGFKGTRFEIPVKDDFDLTSMYEWVEEYAEILNVPVLYREYRGGNPIREEEYGGVSFNEYHNDPPSLVQRPGEFTIAAGPNVGGYKEPDTWLVSMRIDRNTEVSMRTMWNVAVQIHNEQGLIVSGPNRGKKQENVDLQENDVPLPQPTGDRDRFQKDTANKRFFEYVKKTIKHHEIDRAGQIAHDMNDQDEHPADALDDRGADWQVFESTVDYHGDWNATSRFDPFQDWTEKRDEFPDWDEETARHVFALFTSIETADANCNTPNKKSYRGEDSLGSVLSTYDRNNVFMAASISKGAGTQRNRVLHNTMDSAVVIKLDGASKYDEYEEKFGFRKLKDVPREQSDDHEWDVPDSVHDSATRTTKTSTTKADRIDERTLKIRCNTDNKGIDLRWTINQVRTRLENKGTIGSHSELIAFPNGGDRENVSDHYDMRYYGAIVSVSQDEWDELKHLDNALTYEEYTERSRNTVIATEEGGIKARDMSDTTSHFTLLYDNTSAAGKEPKLWFDGSDENQRLLDYLRDYSWDARHYSRKSEDAEADDVLLGVADIDTLERAAWALNRSVFEDDLNLHAIRFNSYGVDVKFQGGWNKCHSIDEYQHKARTPDWSDESSVYNLFGTTPWLDKTLYGMHDAGFNPENVDPQDLETVAGFKLRSLARTTDTDSDDNGN